MKLLVALVETGSVTGAAQTLGVTQSAVSHLLNKLRGIFDDPLFVKSGRGGLATARALALAEEARVLLKELERLAAPQNFDPAQWRGLFTIAANDFQRDALLPALAARLRQSAPRLCLRIIASNVPTLEMLRGEDCQLVISPRPPEGSDILQKRLFSDDYRIFYDKTCRRARRATKPNTSTPITSACSTNRVAPSISTSFWPSAGSRAGSPSSSPVSPACRRSCAAPA